ncbi:16S rRNA (guanine(966)-N(2))-methyltransferase RsmD [soil metagenome]
MRIITGRLKGLTFDSPSGRRTHPMSDKIRGALFNAMGDLQGLTVLDAFAGSGALSFEAISRGAKSAVALELDKDAFRTIANNIEQLGVQDQVSVLRKNVKGWSRSNQHLQFDIVMADPPYDDIRPDLLQNLVQQVKPGGLMVISWPGKEPTRVFDGLSQLSANKYGDAQLVFYRRIG